MAKAQAEKVFAAIVAHAKLPNTPHHTTLLTLSPFGKTFLYKFTGHRDLAISRCRAVYESLRNAKGEWKTFNALTTREVEQQVYVGFDRTPKQAAEGRVGKAMVKQLQEACPKREISFQSRGAHILVDWVQVAKVSCVASDKNEILINPVGLQQISLEASIMQQEAAKVLKQLELSPGGIRWESCI